ncbi:uncharacterized protein DSM5745_02161 [Aspergillus mulundensis]|uniref:Uncharacterized protein n=1 Tax=Aspergillus mulundensis TaxID=1810919 RepID=A0A3D8SVR1_9EURO|nr:Uncharacterized protein DSM5745_02161 [Aspergillus mulundensis]RDW90386.1 Uncharacterized protein DSM5745_02161 [Aspergillus mulundensis]
MSPDINSLPPSRSASASPRQRRNLTSLLDAIASTGASNSSTNSNNNHSNSSTMSSELPRRHHPISVSERRRSGNLNINSSSNNSYSEPIGDNSSASPSEPARASLFNFPNSPIMGFGDPHHHRTPSLGELHQELEQEQEAQVNRLLSTIRNQELRIQHLEQQHQSAIDDATPSSERSVSFPPGASLSTLGSRTSTQLPSSLSSRRPSQGQAHSPSLRPADSTRDMAAPEWVAGPGLSPGESIGRRGSLSREDQSSSFYQAEAASLARENQMLRQRIRDLERQVSEQSTNMTVPSATPGDPSVRQPAAGAGSESELSDKT